LPDRPVNGSGNGARSGAQTLLLLALPLNIVVLKALERGPRRQAELRSEAGFPAQTTLRTQLTRLEQMGAIEKHRRNHFPGVLEYELTVPGRNLLFVVATLERWLARAPSGSLALGSNGAKAAVKALAEGWSTTMLRALAAGPLSLTELDRLIGSLSYPSLERRLGAMRLAGLVEARPSTDRGMPYAVTDWLRRGIAPIAAAVRWERQNVPHATMPTSGLEVEAGFLLTLPLLEPPTDLNGCCRMAAELPNGQRKALAGATVEVDRGEIVVCTTRLAGKPDGWALGSTMAWLDAMVVDDPVSLELGGDCRLSRGLLEGMHRTLFGRGSTKPLDKTSSISEA
jgi:DNA-binding HxlR family transcriptional regulator